MHDVYLAYIDPGAGSIALQLLIGSLVGIGLFLRSGISGLLQRITGPRITEQGCQQHDSDCHGDAH